MVSLTDLAANPDLLIAFQRQQAARRRLEQTQPSEPRTPGATWMSALAQGLMNFQAAQADQRLEAVARQERERSDAEVAQALTALGGLGLSGGAAAPSGVALPAAAAPAAPAAAASVAPALPGRVGAPAATAPNMDPGSPDYDPIAASRARYLSMGGRPLEGSTFRRPEDAGPTRIGANGQPEENPWHSMRGQLPAPSGAFGNVSGQPSPQLPPQQAAPSPPDQRLFSLAQGFVLSRNPQVRALAPLLLQQYERQQVDQREALRDAQANARLDAQLRVQGRETFGAPVTEQGPDAQPIQVRYGSLGSRIVVQGARPEAPRSGLNPIPAYDEAGNPTILLPRTDGTVAPPSLPQGYSLTPRTREIRVGTEVITVDQGGREISRRPIDVAGQETQERVGQQRGTEIAGAPQALRTAEQSIGLIDGALQHPSLRSATGVLAFTGAIPGTPQFDFAQRVEQLRGRAFLEAFESLKGGGAITEIEGRKATDAIARLSRGASAADFRQALGELREVLEGARQRSEALIRPPQAQIGPNGPAADPPPAPRQRLRFNPQTGAIE
jgi:hypothetical protein